jgi:hypothetical protein
VSGRIPPGEDYHRAVGEIAYDQGMMHTMGEAGRVRAESFSEDALTLPFRRWMPDCRCLVSE